MQINAKANAANLLTNPHTFVSDELMSLLTKIFSSPRGSKDTGGAAEGEDENEEGEEEDEDHEHDHEEEAHHSTSGIGSLSLQFYSFLAIIPLGFKSFYAVL